MEFCDAVQQNYNYQKDNTNHFTTPYPVGGLRLNEPWNETKAWFCKEYGKAVGEDFGPRGL